MGFGCLHSAMTATCRARVPIRCPWLSDRKTATSTRRSQATGACSASSKTQRRSPAASATVSWSCSAITRAASAIDLVQRDGCIGHHLGGQPSHSRQVAQQPGQLGVEHGPDRTHHFCRRHQVRFACHGELVAVFPRQSSPSSPGRSHHSHGGVPSVELMPGPPAGQDQRVGCSGAGTAREHRRRVHP